MVNAKLEFDPTLTVARLADVVNELEVELRAAEPQARTIFIEPDVFRAPEGELAYGCEVVAVLGGFVAEWRQEQPWFEGGS